MHNLALALHEKGYELSGSDDEIFEPSKGRLEKRGLLPPDFGWFPEKITSDIDAIILGMHAREDNPELLKARELGLKIYSYPEFLFEQSRNKKRVVIAGSHGKTTITAMVMHVLHQAGMDIDFMVGAQLDGFDVMVRISENAEIMIFEGDEYLTSPIDLRPKFHLYKPHLALISGIAWDHINVFPTFEIYKEQFRIFIDQIEDGGTLVYYDKDESLKEVVNANDRIIKVPYDLPEYRKSGYDISLRLEGKEYPLHVFGEHNLQNIEGARHICKALGISDEQFAVSISSFKGASRRLQLIDESSETSVFLDFAHAPSKLKATVAAVKDHFNDRQLIACMELHTYSSLNDTFLDQYKDSMAMADIAIVYFNPHTIQLKRLPQISIQQVKDAFGREDLMVYNEAGKMLSDLLNMDWRNKTLLLMSSGNFDGLDPEDIAKKILKKE